MNFIVKKTILSASMMLMMAIFPTRMAAQDAPSTPEEIEKKRLEYIDKEKERLTSLLELEYYQEFWVDSVLTHDLAAMQEELSDLQKSKVSNYDMYIAVQDKWNQKIYDAYHRFMTEDQWAKYLKSGALREQQAREKRRDKAAGIKPEKPAKKNKKQKK